MGYPNEFVFPGGCQLVCCVPRPLAVVDVETTGLHHKTDRVVELAVVHCDPAGVPTGEVLSTLVDPGGPVGATHIHGISETDVAGAPSFAEVAGDLVDMLAGRQVVAHNAIFDVRFLSRELTRAARASGDIPEGGYFPLFPVTCTMWSALEAGFAPYTPLAELARHVGHVNDHAHAALDDALAAAAGMRHLLAQARGGGTHVRRFGDPLTPPLGSGDFPLLGRNARPCPRPAVV